MKYCLNSNTFHLELFSKSKEVIRYAKNCVGVVFVNYSNIAQKLSLPQASEGDEINLKI